MIRRLVNQRLVIPKWLMRVAHGALLYYFRLTRPVVLSVRIMLIDDGHVLMLKHTYMPGWFFPGGLVDRHETPLDAAKREAFEEVGVVCNSEPTFLGLFAHISQFQNDSIALFVCDDYSRPGLGMLQEETGPVDKWEIEAVETFPLTDLPEDVWPGTERRVAHYLSGEPPISGRW